MKTIDALYEDGLLKPDTPLALRPGERVALIVDESDLLEARVLRDYIDERISLGKAAELLQLTRFELEASYRRLGIPLRRGARSVEDAQAEIAAARRHA